MLLVGAHLRRAGYTIAIERVDTATGMAAALAAGLWDLVLSDYSLPGFSTPEALSLLRASGQDLPFIIISGAIQEEQAVAALKFGAHDFILKNNLSRLGPAIERELRDALGRQQQREAQAALRAAEEKYRSLVEKVPVIVYVVTFGQENRTTYINPQVETQLGFTPAEWLADPELWKKQVHPDDYARVMAEVQLADTAGRPLDIEYRLLNKAGQPRWFRNQTTLVQDAAGRPQYAHGLLIDITQSKQAEIELARERNLLRTLIDNVPDFIFAKDADSRFTLANQASAASLGHTPDEVLGKTDFELHPPEQAAQFFADEQAVMRANQALMNREEQVLIEGQLHWLLTTTVPLHNAAGQVIGLVGISRDITRGKQAEIALAQDRNLLRTLIDNVPDFIYAKDRASRFTLANRASAGSMGHTPEEVIGKTDLDLHPTDLAEQFLTDEQVVMQSGQPLLDREEMMYENGQERWQLTTTVPLRDEAGLVVGIVGISRNITGRRQAELQLKQRLSQLDALRAIDQAISASLDLALTLAVFLDQVIGQLKVDAADVLLLDADDQTLSYASGRGFHSQAFQHARTRVGEGRAGRAVLERQMVTANLQQERAATRTGLLSADNFVSYFGVPLIAKGQVLGVLELFHRSRLDASPEWLNFLSALAGQAAIALDNAALFNRLQQSNSDLQLAYDATIEGWSRALDLRDRETEGHSQRVTQLSERLAAAMGMPDKALLHLRRGALLHDIGKMGVPDQILLKPGPLSDEEWAIMRQHPTLAYEMLAPIHYLRPALEIPYCHHEKWDGSGYPRKLKGDEIPLSARVFAVVDVWDALRSDRPYRRAWPAERVRAYLREQAGQHFDPAVTAAFLEMVSR